MKNKSFAVCIALCSILSSGMTFASGEGFFMPKYIDAQFFDPAFMVLDGRLPRSRGVYIIAVTPKWDLKSIPLVVYIGSSHDLYDRFRCGGSRGHVYRRLKTLVRNYQIDILYREVFDYYAIEVEMIKKYRPRFNKTHNHG